MPFRLPTFNLVCNLGSSDSLFFPGDFPPPAVWRLVNQPCQLAYGRRINSANGGGYTTGGTPGFHSYLLLPPLTDVRGVQDVTGLPDQVEVPAGSGRYYTVAWVEDIGKGFPNEHRSADIYPYLYSWVPPYP